MTVDGCQYWPAYEFETTVGATEVVSVVAFRHNRGVYNLVLALVAGKGCLIFVVDSHGTLLCVLLTK